MKHFHEDDGRTRHIDQQAGKGERAGQRIGDELRFLQDEEIVVEDGPEPQRDGGVGLMSLWQPPPADGEHQDDERGQDDEDRLPAKMHGHEHADAGREQRRDTQNQNQQRDDFGGFPGGKEIPHHGHARNLRGAATERLHKAKSDEPFHRSRAQAADGGGDKQNQAGIQR
jgi:hypothetical protein